MAVETELKLRIAPEHLARLKRHTLLQDRSAGRVVPRRLYNVYFDTPRLDLHHAAMALRLRRVGDQWLQTLKGGGEVQAGLHLRNEWEIPVAGEALEFPPSPEWDTHLPPRLRDKLQPVFVTDFMRSMRTLEWAGARIELCIDHGEIRTGQRTLPICELELELKSGEARSLFELALAILDVVPCELEVVNKAEYGFRLLAGYTESPRKWEMPALSVSASLPAMLQKLIWSCLLHLQVNLRGATGGNDPEYLHQMRVALRRMRVLLRIAARFRADAQLTELQNEIAALSKTLGRMRDWDVFIAGIVRPMCARRPGDAGRQALLAASERYRDGCYEALRGADQARALQRLILRFALWMNGAYWQGTDAVESPHEFASRLLSKLWRQFRRAATHLEAAGDGQLHALRICAKKLRYGSEFFSSLYDTQHVKPFLTALSEVQEVLGRINDIAVARRLLDELTDAPEGEAHSEALDALRRKALRGRQRNLDVLKLTASSLDAPVLFWKE